MFNNFLGEFSLELSATLAVVVLVYLFTRLRGVNAVATLRLLSSKLRKSGLVATHRSMQEATQNIIASIERTKDLKIISNKGTDWVGHDHALLSDLLVNISVKRGLKFRMLLLSKDAPWLTEGLARKRGKPSLQFFKDEFDNSHRVVEQYFERSNFLPKSGVKYHKVDPTWRMLITNDRYFVSSYATTEQARNSSVLEFKGPDNEFYQAAKRYFNYLWHKNSSIRGEVSEGSTDNIIEFSGGAVVYGIFGNQIKILIIKKHNGKYTLPKGHINKEETIDDGTLREITEETGISISNLEIIKNIGWYPNPISLDDGTIISKVVYYSMVNYVGDNEPELKTDEDHKSAEWVELKTLDTMLFAYEHMKYLITDVKNELL